MRKTQAKFFVVFCTSLLILSTLIVGVGALSTSEDTEKNIVRVRISDGTELSELNRFDIEILERYERFVLIEAGQETIEDIEDAGMEVNRLPNRTRIAVKGYTFDIEGGPDLDPDLTIDGYEEGTEGLYLVHMLGPVHPEWRFTLEEKGVDIVNYVPNHAYEVSMTPETAEEVRELDFVDWVGIYHPEFKLHSRLDEALEEDMSVGLRLRPGFESSSLLELESEFEVHSFEDLREHGYRLVVDVDSMEQLEDIARMNDIYFISPDAEAELQSEIDSQLIGGGAWFMDDEYDHSGGRHREGDPDRPYRKHGDHGAYINQKGYTGKNVTIAVADSGIGNGTVGDAGLPDLTGRVVGGYAFERDSDSMEEGDWGDRDDGHGTHVTGCAAGDTYGGTGETFDFGDYYMAQGLAYESELFATKIFDGLGFLPDEDYRIVEEPAQRSDAYIHTNSWSYISTAGAYGEADEAYDQAVRDADRDTEDNRPMTITVAAGNEGEGTIRGDGNYKHYEQVDQTITSPGNAKNVITVGATQTYHPANDFENAERMANFSSRGWTEDNRVKPDVVAPGEGVYSLDVEGGYTEMSGTSMSTPAVAGAAAVIVEWYEEKYGETPSPAMVRSILINTATDLDPEIGNTRGHIPNRDEGWGITDISKLEYPEDQPMFFTEDEGTLLETGDIEEYTVGSADHSEPLKITLTWTDKNAMVGDSEGGTPTLKNNLDLEVETPGGEVIRGNAFDLSGDGESDDGFTHPDAEVMSDFDYNEDEWDDRNNVQNVYIHPDNIESGEYEVRVIGTDIPADSNNDGSLNQDFALTTYNLKPSSDGEITMDEERYSTEDTVELQILDGSLRDEVEVDMGIYSDTDPTGFNVTLYGGEERYDFTGKVDISETNGAETLEVSHGDTITAEYWDEDTGDGTGAMKNTTAYVDSLPPEPPTQLDVEWEGDDDAHNLLTWTASDHDIDVENDDPEGHVDRYDIYRAEEIDGPWNETNLIGSVVADRSEHYSHMDEDRGDADDERWWYVVRAVKDVGNMEMNEMAVPEPEAYPLEISILSPEDGTIFTVDDVDVEWEGDERIGHYEVRLNDGDRMDMGTATEHRFENVSEGTHMISIFGHHETFDRIGYERVFFMVDMTPPVLDITHPKDSYINESAVTVEWEGYDEVSGIDYYEVQVDDGDWINVDGNTSFTLEDLEHAENYIVRVNATDRAGWNTIESVTFTADLVPPEIEIITPEDDGWAPVNMTAEWYGEDELSGIDNYEVRLDDGEWIDVGNATEYEFTDLSVEEHVLEVRAWDRADNFNTTSTTFDIDPEPPRLEIVSPEEGVIFDMDRVTVVWESGDNYSGLSHIEVRLDGDEWIDVDLSDDYTFTELEDGMYTVNVRAIDNARQKSYDEVTFTVDTTPPELEITSPEHGAISAEDEVTVEWEGSDETSGIDSYDVRIDDGEWMDVGLDESYVFEDLEDGDHTVEVRATDKVGNSAQDEVTFTVDTTPPELEITSPEAGEMVGSAKVTVSWTGSDEISGIDSYDVRIDDGDWEDVELDESYVFEDLEDGDHTVEVRATDSAGHHSIESVEFTVDTTPPEVDILTPEDGKLFAEDEVDVTWTGSDEISGIELYDVRIDDGDWEDVGLDESYVFEDLEDGDHTVEVRATNKAGNSNQDEVTFTVDTTPPELEITSPEHEAIYAEDEVTVKWEGSDEISGIELYDVRIDDGDWEDVELDESYVFEDLEDGDHTVEVRATDEAGNSAQDEVTFTVDTTPPELSITSPEAGVTVDDDEVTVRWEATDEVSGVSGYEVRLNQDEWIDVGLDTEYTFEDVSEGDNTVEIRAVDEAGNEKVEDLSFTVDEGVSVYWWMLLGAIVVVLGMIVLFTMKSREKGSKSESEAGTSAEESTEEEEYTSEEKEEKG